MTFTLPPRVLPVCMWRLGVPVVAFSLIGECVRAFVHGC